MGNNFSMTAKSEYDLFNNNCATAVQKAMLDALVIGKCTGLPPSRQNMSGTDK